MPDLAERIKAEAQSLGFAACGIAPAFTPAAPAATAGHLKEWLVRGYQAAMHWMSRPEAVARRHDMQRILPGARSAICVAMLYRTDEPWPQETHGLVARYARGRDYHNFMTRRLRRLLRLVQQTVPCQGRVYVDTGPVLERELAQRAGLGWVGKNTMLLSRRLGSYFLLGEIILDVELPYDQPELHDYCGSCTRCMDACPTDALVAPRVLDAGRCISYHTIEAPGTAPAQLGARFGDWVFGCDICQEVCPWNVSTGATSAEPELWTGRVPPLLQVLRLDAASHAQELQGSPLKRAGRHGFKKNVLQVLRNRKAGQSASK